MAKKPALVCLNNFSNTITRYVPKPTGGFYSERFEIVNPEECSKALTQETMEQFRLGRMRDQETPPELEDQYA